MNDPAFLVDLFNRIDVGFSIFCLEDLKDAFSLHWVSSNAKAAHILNLPVQQYFGKRLADAFPQLAKSGRLEIYADVVRTQVEHDLPEVVTDATEYTATRVYSVKAFPLLNQCVGIRFEDVTDLRQSQREIEQHAARLKVLSDISKELATATSDYTHLLATIARRVAEVIQDICLIRLISEDGIYLNPVAFHDTHPETYELIKHVMISVPVRTDEHIFSKVLASGKSLLIPDIPAEQFRSMVKQEFSVVLDRFTTMSVMIVPLRVQERNTGLIFFLRHDPTLPRYDENDIRLAEDLAERAALAIENARLVNELEKRVLERTRQLTQLNQELETTLMHEIEVGDLKTRFISMVSHEFRTPLSIIQLAAETVKKYRARLAEEVIDQKLDIIRRQIQHLSALVESILFVNRAEQVGVHASKADFNLAQLSREVMQNLSTLNDNRQGIILREFGDCTTVYSDRMLVQHILSNLLSNAIKYSPPSAPIQVNLFCEADVLTMQVRDQGIGIPREDLQNLFQMFYRASNAHQAKGIGVGLVVVKQAVDALNGSIMVESEVNKGTAFTIVIPTAA
jgi:signal transduction histidine kinase